MVKDMIWAFECYGDSSEIWAQDLGRVGYEQTEKNKEINQKKAQKKD